MNAILKDSHGVGDLSLFGYYCQQIEHDKILVVEIDKAIFALSQTEGVQEYTIDTGQDRQTVRRCDIGTLERTKSRLLGEIGRLSRAVRGEGNWEQIVPGF